MLQLHEPTSIAHCTSPVKPIQHKHHFSRNLLGEDRIKRAKEGISHIPYGRALLEEELQTYCPEGWQEAMQYLYLEGKVAILAGVCLQGMRCNRCGQDQLSFTVCYSCEEPCAYCTSCIQMGRSKACSPLYYISDACASRPSKPKLLWNGQLTDAQREASNRARSLLTSHNNELLIWAVCGAGKTEVTFHTLEEALQQQQKVLFVTPRKDVVLELAPRFQAVFPEARVIALHGKSQEKWEEAHLTLSTTHQAMRFYQKFDLVIIDEVDAYPYHNNPMLYYAVNRAKKQNANLIYLSATPPDYLRRKPHIRIPARYHRKPLAVPHFVLDSSLPKLLNKDSIFPVMQQILRYIEEKQRQAFFFVPFIEGVDKLVNQLTKNEFKLTVEGTHSRDPQREEKVKRFRSGRTRILVTTTIMERGITVPKTDVIVIQADAPIFDEASLVQISGRAGRSIEDPVGHVIFMASHKTKEMVKAVKHIKEMNKIAKKMGLIDL